MSLIRSLIPLTSTASQFSAELMLIVKKKIDKSISQPVPLNWGCKLVKKTDTKMRKVKTKDNKLTNKSECFWVVKIGC